MTKQYDGGKTVDLILFNFQKAFDKAHHQTLLEKWQTSLLDHATAVCNNDPHLTKLLEDVYVEEQVETMKNLGDMINQLKRAGTSGLDEYVIDKDLKC